MTFTWNQVVAAAGIGDPHEIAAQVTSGDPAAIRGMGAGFTTAAGHARNAMSAAQRADDITARSYVVDGVHVHDAPAATARSRSALADGGEHMGEVARALDEVATGLDTARGRVGAAQTALDAELATVTAASQALAGRRFPTQADADAAERALFDRAVTAVRTHGGTIATAVTGYDDLLRGRSGRLASFGYAAPPGTDGADGEAGPQYESLQPEGMLSPAEIARLGLDITGIVDPTPVSDGLSGLISLFRGEWGQAGMSMIALVPWIGDSVKVLKWGKDLESLSHLSKLVGDVPRLQAVLKSLGHVNAANWNSALGTMNRMAGDAEKAYKNPKFVAAAEKRGLPTGGAVPFVPPKGWNASDPHMDTLYGRRGYQDRYDNVWYKDPIKGEWDVQIRPRKDAKFDIFSSDGKHANISPDGTVTH